MNILDIKKRYLRILQDIDYVMYQDKTDKIVLYAFVCVNDEIYVRVMTRDNQTDYLLFETFAARYNGCYDLGEL
jgi:hypothetical protein